MSFKDAFTKEGAGGNQLNYDDAAFAYFASTCLICILVPWTITYVENRIVSDKTHSKFLTQHILSKGWCFLSSRIRRIRQWREDLYTVGSDCKPKGSSSQEYVQECGCSLCAHKRAVLNTHSMNTMDYIQIAGMILLGLLIWYIGVNYLSLMPNVASFNPWNILNITESASEKEIRKAFRTMSLKYHPDKNPNDASAASQFILISKAYTTLTDEVAKKNFEKFGNPDGRTGMMKVGIGLPTFMIKEEFQIFILAVFFVFLLVIVPGLFLLYYWYINLFASNGLRKDTVHLLGGTMGPKIGAHRIIALIASSSEIRNLSARRNTLLLPALRNSNRGKMSLQEEVELLRKKCQGKEMDRLGTMSPEVLKACLLIYIHLSRDTHTLPKYLQEESRAILRESIRVSRAMLDVAFVNNWIPTIQTVLAVRKCLLQSVEIGSLPVNQIPHILCENMPDKQKRAKQLLETIQKHKPADLHDLAKVALENKATAFKDLTPEEINDVEVMFKTIPKIKLEGKVFVDDEEEICQGDVATCRLTVTRENLQEHEVQGNIHSPYYPEFRKEEWFVFISDAQTNELYGYKTITDNSRKVDVDIQFLISHSGVWNMTAVILSEAFFGVDKSVNFSFKAIHPDESTRKEIVHPDDVALDGQASFVQQMLGTNALQGEEEDDEEDDEENEECPRNEASESQQSGEGNFQDEDEESEEM